MMSFQFNKKVIFGSIFVMVIAILYGVLLINGFTYQTEVNNTPKAKITVIGAISIPTVDINLLQLTPTATIDANLGGNSGIGLQKYVKITGTEGSGLRIRSLPGKTTEIIFLANDAEVFLVIGGPQETDGLIWWQLAAPYDQTRQGWAAADYLILIADQ